MSETILTLPVPIQLRSAEVYGDIRSGTNERLRSAQFDARQACEHITYLDDRGGLRALAEARAALDEVERCLGILDALNRQEPQR